MELKNSNDLREIFKNKNKNFHSFLRYKDL